MLKYSLKQEELPWTTITTRDKVRNQS